MKMLISLSAVPEYFVLEYGSSVILTLQEVERRPIKRGSLNLTFADLPYLHFNKEFVWDKGTEDERVVPTVDMLSVPKRLRDRGYGKQLVLALLDFLKKNKIRHTMFDDYSGGFWKNIKSKRISFPEQFDGRIGYIDL